MLWLRVFRVARLLVPTRQTRQQSMMRMTTLWQRLFHVAQQAAQVPQQAQQQALVQVQQRQPVLVQLPARARAFWRALVLVLARPLVWLLPLRFWPLRQVAMMVSAQQRQLLVTKPVRA